MIVVAIEKCKTRDTAAIIQKITTTLKKNTIETGFRKNDRVKDKDSLRKNSRPAGPGYCSSTRTLQRQQRMLLLSANGVNTKHRVQQTRRRQKKASKNNMLTVVVCEVPSIIQKKKSL
jgi:hypothetical protein